MSKVRKEHRVFKVRRVLVKVVYRVFKDTKVYKVIMVSKDPQVLGKMVSKDLEVSKVEQVKVCKDLQVQVRKVNKVTKVCKVGQDLKVVSV